ncbi:hypothetical protein ACOMHN_031983 [Nucella lapillus]
MKDIEKWRRMNGLATHIKMVFSCFGSRGQVVGSSMPYPTRKSTSATLPCSGREGETKRSREGEATEGGGGEGRVSRRKRKAVVVGDGECGKTCLLQRFCRDTYNLHGYLPTVFDTDVVDVQLDSGTTVELTLTDTAGQEDYDRLRPYSYPDTDVVIVCFAIDNPDSLENVRLNWMPEIRYFCGNVPVILVGNKTDLRGHGEGESALHSTASSQDFLDFPECCPSAALIKQGPVKESAARRMAGEVGAVGYWETSALLDQGVTEVFYSACRAALKGPQSGKKVRCRRKRSFLERVGLKRPRQV